MSYPEWVKIELDDWPDFANRCKSVMLERGDISQGQFQYENLYIKIVWKRERQRGSYFEVTRRPMPDHPELDGLDEARVVYAEVNCITEHTHWEAGLIYNHVLEVTRRSTEIQNKKPGKRAREPWK